MTTEHAPSNVMLSRTAVTSTAMIFGLTYSLSAALIALDLDEMGFSEAIIGANAAMLAVGVLCMAFLLPRLSAWLGMRSLVIVALCCSCSPARPISRSSVDLAVVSAAYSVRRRI